MSQHEQIGRCPRHVIDTPVQLRWIVLSSPYSPIQGKGPGIWRLMRYNRPEWHWIALGVAGSAVVGLIMPTFALSLGNVIAVFFVTDYSYMNQEVHTACAFLPASCCGMHTQSTLHRPCAHFSIQSLADGVSCAMLNSCTPSYWGPQMISSILFSYLQRRISFFTGLADWPGC